jgi:predicted nucleotidyltransferase
VGRQRLLHPDERSPFYRELYGLLVKAFGPDTVLGPALSAIGGIDEAYIYGSWAARYHGEPGLAPADIDVLVVGRPARIALAGAERQLSGVLGRDVNAVIVSPEDWRAAASGFLQDVRNGPLVPIRLSDGPD